MSLWLTKRIWSGFLAEVPQNLSMWGLTKTGQTVKIKVSHFELLFILCDNQASSVFITDPRKSFRWKQITEIYFQWKVMETSPCNNFLEQKACEPPPNLTNLFPVLGSSSRDSPSVSKTNWFQTRLRTLQPPVPHTSGQRSWSAECWELKTAWAGNKLEFDQFFLASSCSLLSSVLILLLLCRSHAKWWTEFKRRWEKPVPFNCIGCTQQDNKCSLTGEGETMCRVLGHSSLSITLKSASFIRTETMDNNLKQIPDGESKANRNCHWISDWLLTSCVFLFTNKGHEERQNWR